MDTTRGIEELTGGALDARRATLMAARGRLGLGIAAALFPGVVSRAFFGGGSVGPRTKAAARLVGIRDFVVGAATVMALKDGSHPENWLSMGALIDLGDSVVMVASPGVSTRGRLFGATVALSSAAVHFRLARELADASLDAERAELEAVQTGSDSTTGAGEIADEISHRVEGL